MPRQFKQRPHWAGDPLSSHTELPVESPTPFPASPSSPTPPNPDDHDVKLTVAVPARLHRAAKAAAALDGRTLSDVTRVAFAAFVEQSAKRRQTPTP